MLEQTRLKYVKVTNNFDTPYVDMFDGIPVTIDAHGSQNLRPEQAFHFFAYVEGARRQDMLMHVAKRRGWITPAFWQPDENGKTLAEKNFDKLVIEPVTFKLVEEAPADLDAPIPAEAGLEEEGEPPERVAPPPRLKSTPSRQVPSRPARDD